MFNWNNPLEPPVTMNLSEEIITNMIKNGSQHEIEELPCHSPAVERHMPTFHINTSIAGNMWSRSKGWAHSKWNQITKGTSKVRHQSKLFW